MLFRNRENNIRPETSLSAFMPSGVWMGFCVLLGILIAKDPVGICLYALNASLSDGLNPQSCNKTWIKEQAEKCQLRKDLPVSQNEFMLPPILTGVIPLIMFMVTLYRYINQPAAVKAKVDGEQHHRPRR